MVALVRLIGAMATDPRWSDPKGLEELRLYELVKKLTDDHHRAGKKKLEIEAPFSLERNAQVDLET